MYAHHLGYLATSPASAVAVIAAAAALVAAQNSPANFGFPVGAAVTNGS